MAVNLRVVHRLSKADNKKIDAMIDPLLEQLDCSQMGTGGGEH
jgi:hypothetical protein